MELLENNPAEIVVEAAAPEEEDNDLSAQEDSEEDAAPADAGDGRPVSPPPPAARFGLPEAERKNRSDKRPYAFVNEERPTGSFRSETALTSLSGRQESSPASKAANLRSNKRHKPGD